MSEKISWDDEEKLKELFAEAKTEDLTLASVTGLPIDGWVIQDDPVYSMTCSLCRENNVSIPAWGNPPSFVMCKECREVWKKLKAQVLEKPEAAY